MTPDRWSQFSLATQLGHIGSELGRAKTWQNKDHTLYEQALNRALILLNFTLNDPRWTVKMHELTNLHDLIDDIIHDTNIYQSNIAELESYCTHLALNLARG